MAMSDLYVHAADVEIEAIACLEAVASGLVPVIADSPLSATSQFALDHRSLFEAGNVDDLAERIDWWYEHATARHQMARVYAESANQYRLKTAFGKQSRCLRKRLRRPWDKWNGGSTGMILVKDRTGSKNGTADSTLVGVFDSKRPLYRLVKWLILHIFRRCLGCCTDFGWSVGYRRKNAERLYQRLQSCSQAGLRDVGMRVSGLYDAVFIVGI